MSNLTVIADVNGLGQSEPTMYQHDMEVYRRKFEAEILLLRLAHQENETAQGRCGSQRLRPQ